MGQKTEQIKSLLLDAQGRAIEFTTKNEQEVTKQQEDNVFTKIWRILVLLLVTGDFAMSTAQTWIASKLPEWISMLSGSVVFWLTVLGAVLIGLEYPVSYGIRWGYNGAVSGKVLKMFLFGLVGVESLVCGYIGMFCFTLNTGVAHWINFFVMCLTLLAMLVGTTLVCCTKLTSVEDASLSEVLKKVANKERKIVMWTIILTCVFIGVLLMFAITPILVSLVEK